MTSLWRKMGDRSVESLDKIIAAARVEKVTGLCPPRDGHAWEWSYYSLIVLCDEDFLELYTPDMDRFEVMEWDEFSYWLPLNTLTPGDEF